MSSTDAAMVRFGMVVIDEATREIRVGGELRHVQPQAFDVLWFLVTHRDRVVPKSEIFDVVWDAPFVTESALTTRIKEIRRAVGDDGRTQGVIKSIRGIGYRFVAEVTADALAPPEQAKPWRALTLRLHPKRLERRPGEPIAYATVGAGPPLLFMPGWISSLDALADGTDPRSAMVTALAQHFSVTIFDRYGTGLSTASDVDTSLDGSVAEVQALLRIIDGPVTVFASSAAGPASLIASAGHANVGALVLLCTYASGPDLFTNADNRRHLLGLVRSSWGMGSRILADMIVPGIAAATRSTFARFQRRTATPEVAAGYIQQLYEADATAALAHIQQRCLVMHYRQDPAIPFAGAHQLAMGIPDAELMPLDGPFHTPPEEHVQDIAGAVLRFVSPTPQV